MEIMTWRNFASVTYLFNEFDESAVSRRFDSVNIDRFNDNLFNLPYDVNVGRRFVTFRSESQESTDILLGILCSYIPRNKVQPLKAQNAFTNLWYEEFAYVQKYIGSVVKYSI